MEEQLLPRAELAPAYDRAVWLYLYRDFSGNAADQAAERVCLRLGLSAYPQHLLVHPETLALLGDTGRAVEGFLAAMERTRVPAAPGSDAPKRIREADARSEALRKSGSVAEARRALEEADLLVRYRAVEILAAKDPAGLVPRAADLLALPHDPLRFLLCEGLKKAARPDPARALEKALRDPAGSLNPNVLRIRAADALGACGDGESVAALAPFAASGEFRNGLTKIAVDALAAIAARVATARPAVRDALAASYPPPAPDAGCLALAKAVHAALEKVTGRKVPFPSPYDAAARERLAKAWR